MNIQAAGNTSSGGNTGSREYRQLGRIGEHRLQAAGSGEQVIRNTSSMEHKQQAAPAEGNTGNKIHRKRGSRVAENTGCGNTGTREHRQAENTGRKKRKASR